MNHEDKLSNQEKYYSTDHVNKNLKKHAARGAVYTLGSQITNLFVQLGTTAVLARVLTPGDFGLIAMAGSATGLIILFQDAGLSMATVQRENISQEQLSNLFWINVGISIAAALCVAGSAQLWATFFNDSRIFAIILALSIGVALGGTTIQHQALMRRQMKLGALNIIAVGEKILQVVVALTLALAGAGYWALVGQQLAKPVWRFFAFYLLHPWKPGLPRRYSNTKPLLVFGGTLLTSRFVNYLRLNIHKVLMGKFCNITQLGFYNKMNSLIMLPVQQLYGLFNNTVIPSLSRVQSDQARFIRMFNHGIFLMAFIAFPVIVLMALCSREIVLILLGDQWMAAVPIMRILSLKAAFTLIDLFIAWVFIPLGRVKQQLHYLLIYQSITILSFFIGIKWGVWGVVIAETVATSISIIPMAAYAFKGTPVSVGLMLKAIWRPSFGSVIAGLLTIILLETLSINVMANLILVCATFSTIYYLFWLIVPGRKLYLSILVDMLEQIKYIDKYNFILKKILVL